MSTPAPIFPARIATLTDLKVANNRVQTTLSAPLGAGDTNILVKSSAGFAPNMLISIDDEIISISAAGNPLTVDQRGFDGTVAASHAIGAKVSGFVDAWHHNVLRSEITAIETFIGPNGQNLGNGPFVLTGPFAFPPQAPGGSLVIGNNVVTLAPVPPGVNGTDTNHYLYISGGAGAAEAALITGGTAVAGAASGTVIVNCANPHSGGWTIRSATSGVKEAIVAATPGATVMMPPGTLPVSHLVVDKAITLAGQGRLGTKLVPLLNSGAYLVTVKTPAISGGIDIRDFGIDLTGFPSMSGLNVQNMSYSDVRNLMIMYGLNGIVLSGPTPGTPSVVYTAFRNLAIVNQTGVAFLQDGDTCWENFYNDFFIHLDDTGTGMVCGFKVTRAISLYTGAYHMRNINVNRVGSPSGPLINGFVFTSSMVNTMDIFMTDCVADGINGDALVLTNVDDVFITQCWFASSGGGATGNCIVLDGAAQVKINGCKLVSFGGSSIRYLNAPSGIIITNCQLATTAGYFNLIIPAQAPTNVVFGNNLTNGIPFANTGFLVYSSAQQFNPQSGMEVWTDPTSGGPNCLDVFDPLSAIHFLLRNAGGVLEGTNTDASQVSWSSDQSGNFIAQTYNYIASETGAANAIAGSLPNRVLAAGLVVRILLAHTVQAGANTFALNGGAAKAIKSSRNPANNIGTAYAVGGVLEMMYDGTQWLDVSQ